MRDMLSFFLGPMCRRLVPNLIPQEVSKFIQEFITSAPSILSIWIYLSSFHLFLVFFLLAYYKISGFHNFKKVDIARKKSCMYLIILKC